MFFLGLTIVILLLLATLFIEWKIHKQTTPEGLNNRKRIISWWLILFICLPVFYFGGTLLLTFIFTLSIWATFEFFRLLSFHFQFWHLLVISLLCVLYAVITPILLNEELTIKPIIFLSLPFFLIMILLFCLKKNTQPLLKNGEKVGGMSFKEICKWGVILFSVSALSSLLFIEKLSLQANFDSGLLIFFIFILAAVNDISQYIAGKLFGKNPLAKQLSPNKTREGAIGGIVFTGFIGMLFLPFIIDDLSWPGAWALSSLLAATGIMGDLSLSVFKRKAGVKDTGNSIPGHGGLLDRIDSLLFIAPVFSIYLLISAPIG